MSQQTLEERVSSLENAVESILSRTNNQRGKDWRSTVGMFEGDSVMAEIQEEGRRIREADRQAAKQEPQS